MMVTNRLSQTLAWSQGWRLATWLGLLSPLPLQPTISRLRWRSTTEPEQANDSRCHQAGWSWRLLPRIVLVIFTQQLAGWFSPKLRCFKKARRWPRCQLLIGRRGQRLGRCPQQLTVLSRQSPTMPWVPASLLQLWRQPMGLKKSQ
jgi:hypothetical protein